MFAVETLESTSRLVDEKSTQVKEASGKKQQVHVRRQFRSR